MLGLQMRKSGKIRSVWGKNFRRLKIFFRRQIVNIQFILFFAQKYNFDISMSDLLLTNQNNNIFYRILWTIKTLRHQQLFSIDFF